MAYSFEIPVGTSGNTFTATVETATYSCNMLEEYLSSPQIRFRYNCTYAGYYGPDPCYVNSDVVVSVSPSSYGKVGMSINQIKGGWIKAYSQPEDYTNAYATFTTVEFAESWGGDPRNSNTQFIPYNGFEWSRSQITAISQWTISTNIPIFATDADLQEYLSTGQGIEKAVNYVYSPVLDKYDYVSTTKTVHETLTDRYTCGELEKYKTNPIFWSKGRISVRGNGGYIDYRCSLQHPYGTDRAAIVISKTFSNFMGCYRYADRTTVLLDALINWDSGSSQMKGQGENYDGLVWAYTNATLEVSTNIPIFRSNELAYAYVRANTQEEALQAITKAVNYRVEYPEVVGDKFTSAQLNLLRRRLIRLAAASIDYTKYFEYTIADGYAWITKVKGDVWYQDFRNRDIYFPDELEGHPVVLVSQTWN